MNVTKLNSFSKKVVLKQSFLKKEILYEQDTILKNYEAQFNAKDKTFLKKDQSNNKSLSSKENSRNWDKSLR